MPTHTEKQLASKEIFKGHIIQVTLDTVELENKKQAQREIVHHPGGAGIVAINKKGEVALVRQFRYAIGREVIEIPAGKIEPGEPPRASALRELEEEAGCTADYFEAFGKVLPTVGYCTETIYLFLATGLHKTAQHLDEDEFLDVFWMPLEQAADLVLTGEIIDSKTVAGLLKAKILKEQGKLNY